MNVNRPIPEDKSMCFDKLADAIGGMAADCEPKQGVGRVTGLQSANQVSRLTASVSIRWTPLQIEILLFHYYSPSDARHPGAHLQVYRDAMQNFLESGLIDRTDYPALTRKGLALVGMILSTPLPKEVFVDPRTGGLV